MNELTASDPRAQRLRRLERRLDQMEEEREHRTVAGACSQCYAVLAGLVVALSFFPILGDDVVDDGYGSTRTYTFGSIWEMASQGQSGNPAGYGAILMIGLAVMLVVAVFRQSPGAGRLHGWIAVVAGVLAVMLLLKPGTGDADPPLTEAGQAGVAVMILTVVLAIVHVTYAIARRRRGAGAPARPTTAEASTNRQ